MNVCKVVFGFAVLLFASLVVACGSNPNEHVQSNEYFRPSAADHQQQAAADSQEEDQEQRQRSEREEQVQDDQQEATSESRSDQQSGQDEQAEDQSDQADDQAQAEQDAAPLETSEDVVRRYASPTYGYSLELICSPFCDASSTGIDRVMFRSETGRALISIEVYEDDGSESAEFLRSALALGDNVEFTEFEETSTITGEPAERFGWEEDRRATGGFHVRWHAMLIRVDELAIVLRAGSVMEDYDGVLFALERAMESFILPLEIEGRPGRYERFDFTIAYDTADFAQEFGQPTNAPPSDEAGIFVLQTTNALKAVLTWQLLGEAFYDGDTAISQSLRNALGIENVSGFRDAADVDGTPARTGETETQFGEGTMKIRSFAWYCRDSGREFVLHVLDPDDPESVALPLIESFRCTTDGAEDAE
ncbi:MAG: hypothetical protein OXG27_00905 [Chloroflexi bacterium]|nr:hypothetical protein [Chloroflexota bacterium]